MRDRVIVVGAALWLASLLSVFGLVSIFGNTSKFYNSERNYYTNLLASSDFPALKISIYFDEGHNFLQYLNIDSAIEQIDEFDSSIIYYDIEGFYERMAFVYGYSDNDCRGFLLYPLITSELFGDCFQIKTIPRILVTNPDLSLQTNRSTAGIRVKTSDGDVRRTLVVHPGVAEIKTLNDFSSHIENLISERQAEILDDGGTTHGPPKRPQVLQLQAGTGAPH